MKKKHNPDHLPAAARTHAEEKEAKPQPLPCQDEKKEQDQALSEYTYMIAHDLNAPLRHIMQYGDLLKKEVGGRLGTDGTMYVNKLIASTKRLQQFINDLMSYAQIIHLREEKQVLDLNRLVADVIGNMRTAVEESGAIINVEELPALAAYPFRITQIFQQLITNALKYRGARQAVVTIACSDKNSYHLFSVQDNGIGIEEKNHRAIFRALKRFHTQDEIEGSGLGLAICEKAVEAHGGQIWVQSTPGEGSIFFFTLPKH